MPRKILLALSLIAGLFAASQPVIAAPERVAILGDSITYDGRWPTRVEAALLATPQFGDAEIVDFGIGSETVSGLSEPNHAGGKFPRPCLHERLERILDAFHPTLILACYGMNDGIYLPLDPVRFQAYKDGIEKLKAAADAHHAPIIFITPPLHNADKPDSDPNHYDSVLDTYGNWLVSRRTDGWQVIDIRPDLKKAVSAEKATNPAFIYANDNIHPGDDGHRFIAESITRQLWPILKLQGTPAIPNNAGFTILFRRSSLLKLAWLTKTRHLRPGIPAGLPVEEAETQAAKLLDEYRTASSKAP